MEKVGLKDIFKVIINSLGMIEQTKESVSKTMFDEQIIEGSDKFQIVLIHWK